MKPRGQMTDAEETARWMNAEVDELLDELSYLPPLEIAQGLIEDPGDLEEGHARRLAAILRDRVRGAGVMKTRMDPPPLKRAAAPVRPVRPAPVAKPVRRAAASARDLFSDEPSASEPSLG